MRFEVLKCETLENGKVDVVIEMVHKNRELADNCQFNDLSTAQAYIRSSFYTFFMFNLEAIYLFARGVYTADLADYGQNLAREHALKACRNMAQYVASNDVKRPQCYYDFLLYRAHFIAALPDRGPRYTQYTKPTTAKIDQLIKLVKDHLKYYPQKAEPVAHES